MRWGFGRHSFNWLSFMTRQDSQWSLRPRPRPFTAESSWRRCSPAPYLAHLASMEAKAKQTNGLDGYPVVIWAVSSLKRDAGNEIRSQL